MTTKDKKKLGGKIHKLLNLTISRRLTVKEYSKLAFYIAGLFDEITHPITYEI